MNKRIYKHILFWGIFSCLIFSCDYVSDPIEPNTVIDNPSDSAIRKVLLEDYTGHRCVACPPAAKEANETLKPLYKDQLIIIGVHVTSIFAAPSGTKFPADYRTVAGNSYESTFGVNNLPNGMVNRKGFPTNEHLLSYGAWGAAIANIINTPADADIEINNDYNSTSNLLNTSITTKFLNPLTGTYKLTVMLVEDSIISPQKFAAEDKLDYVHRHVLRDNINGAWGETIESGTMVPGKEYKKDYSNYSLNSLWDPSHCYVIAFAYDSITYEVIQVEEMKIK